MMLFTAEIMAKLRANNESAKLAYGTGAHDPVPVPVVKIFTPDANATWLLTEIDEGDEGDLLFGLCDLGLGFAELGYVSRAELESLRGKFGLPVERDRGFTGHAPLSVYADYVMGEGSIAAAERGVRANADKEPTSA
jgi:hypothetical protein